MPFRKAKHPSPREGEPGQAVIEALGRELHLAEAGAFPVAPIRNRFPGLSVADAYAVQEEYARRRRSEGAAVVGHKIGATSKAIQTLFGIDTPDYGHLFDDMRVGAEPVRTRDLIQPLVEPEIAFVLAEDLTGPGVGADDVLTIIEAVVPCLEIIDSRIENWDISLVDTVADNGSSARFVLGKAVPLGGRNLARESVTLERNGIVVASGNGAEVLGHPARSAAWLANVLSEFGVVLRAGEVLLSGSMTIAIPARGGDVFEAAFSSIGQVSVSFA